MPTIRTLQQLILAGALALVTGLASAGNGPSPSPSPSSGSNDLLLMVILAGGVASSIDCTSDVPSMCTKDGPLQKFFRGTPTGTVKQMKVMEVK